MPETPAPYHTASDPAPASEVLVAALSLAMVEVAAHRSRVCDETDYMQSLIAAVKESEEYKQADARRIAAAKQLAEDEETAQRLALELFIATGMKSRPGVKIKKYTTKKPRYDLPEAMRWAREKAPEFMILDVRLFEAHALAVANTVPLPFVTIDETMEYRAQLDKDLREIDLLIGENS